MDEQLLSLVKNLSELLQKKGHTFQEVINEGLNALGIELDVAEEQSKETSKVEETEDSLLVAEQESAISSEPALEEHTATEEPITMSEEMLDQFLDKIADDATDLRNAALNEVKVNADGNWVLQDYVNNHAAKGRIPLGSNGKYINKGDSRLTRIGGNPLDIFDVVKKQYENANKQYTGTPDDFVKYTEELNERVKEMYYAYYLTTPDADMEKGRLEAIKLYMALKEKGKDNFERLDASKKLDDATLSYRMEDLITQEKVNRTFHSVGADCSPSLGQDFETRFSPKAFDISFNKLFDYLITFVEDKAHTSNRGLLTSGLEYIDKIIAQLQQMSIEEYREHKIMQMGLKQPEIERFQSDIREYIKRKQQEPAQPDFK